MGNKHPFYNEKNCQKKKGVHRLPVSSPRLFANPGVELKGWFISALGAPNSTQGDFKEEKSGHHQLPKKKQKGQDKKDATLLLTTEHKTLLITRSDRSRLRIIG